MQNQVDCEFQFYNCRSFSSSLCICIYLLSISMLLYILIFSIILLLYIILNKLHKLFCGYFILVLHEGMEWMAYIVAGLCILLLFLSVILPPPEAMISLTTVLLCLIQLFIRYCGQFSQSYFTNSIIFSTDPIV